jgi:hypothetical protein
MSTMSWCLSSERLAEHVEAAGGVIKKSAETLHVRRDVAEPGGHRHKLAVLDR